jgi:hypothetical protein
MRAEIELSIESSSDVVDSFLLFRSGTVSDRYRYVPYSEGSMYGLFVVLLSMRHHDGKTQVRMMYYVLGGRNLGLLSAASEPWLSFTPGT